MKADGVHNKARPVCGFFYVLQNCQQLVSCETGPMVSLSLPEKTRKPNHLQMLLQRQHFLLIYLKTLSVGPARAQTHNLTHSSPILNHLS